MDHGRIHILIVEGDKSKYKPTLGRFVAQRNRDEKKEKCLLDSSEKSKAIGLGWCLAIFELLQGLEKKILFCSVEMRLWEKRYTHFKKNSVVVLFFFKKIWMTGF